MSITSPIALDRALSLLNAILADGGRNGVSAIASSLEVPTATAYRLTAAFVAHGFVVSFDRGKYAPGRAILEAMDDSSVTAILARVAEPFLKRLARQFRCVSHLGTFEDGMVTYHVKAGEGSAAKFTREGMQLEAYCSAIGKVLLAHLPQHEFDEYLAGGLFVRLTNNTIVDKTILAEEIKKVNSLGFAIDDCESADDLMCIGVPLLDSNETLRAAISISASPLWLKGRRFDKALDRLLEIAEEIRYHIFEDKRHS